jgi:hypothetical protein
VRTLVIAALLASGVAAAQPPAGRKTVAVLEYRSGARGGAGIGERLAKLLAANAALEVVSPQDARRRAGAKLDADVARCAGEPMCIGTLGEGLGADEVLLIGISQLGDVVLAMQRIDAKKGVAGARMAESMAPDHQPTDEDMLGWLRQLFPPDVFKRYGGIRILSDLPGATVSINGENQGKTPLGEPLKVRAPGSYKVRVTKPGHVPFEAGIDVMPDGNVEVRATLVREAGRVPWYQRWYVWAAIGGAVAVAGASVGIYYGTRVDETPMGFIQLPPK